MDIEVARSVLKRLLVEASAAHPNEACGLLLGRANRIETIVPAANVHPDPLTRFEIDPAALIAAHRAERAGGAVLLGYYHSHPAGHPRPSAIDCEHASGDGRCWAIVAGGEVGWFRDGPGGFAALSYRIVDG